MTYRRDTASDGARGRKENSVDIFGDGMFTVQDGGRSTASAFSSTVGGSAALDLPIPMKNGHASALHDTGVRFKIVSEPEHPGPNLLDPEAFIEQHHEKLTHLEKSLTVRLTLERRSNNAVRILCASEDVGCNGIRIHLPCKLSLIQGSSVGMELFLPTSKRPVSVQGIVREVTRSESEDIIRYKVDIEFSRVSSPESEEIAAFVHESQLQGHRQMVA